ncbi:hypothetical protein [Coleofasciculus chthonoplastes]|uniref:hypothetical protein n=1 Tax=Coleofasciculus chthonoplastes TaxID=64178 RepID=UPI0012FA000F|nr:hypothetical protein [Coleofasciculus chthonoplastes]
MARLYNGAESPNRCVYCYIFNVSFRLWAVKSLPVPRSPFSIPFLITNMKEFS